MIESRRVWSLLDIMNYFNARALYHQLSLFGMYENLIMELKDAGSPIADSGKERFIKLLGTVKEACAGNMFTDAVDTLERVEYHVGDGKRQDPSSILAHLQHIDAAIRKELLSRVFLHVLADRIPFLDCFPNQFGPNVLSAFPSAVTDIRDAGNCLAIECSTAAVFHLMRVAEHGLRALAYDRRISVRKGPIELAGWDEIIKKLETSEQDIQNYKKTLAREAQFEFYHGAMMEFKRFKNTYRNRIMHSRDQYDRGQALITFNHVRTFMQILAGKIAEGARTPRVWKQP